jgi:hypothetical protein
MKKIIFVFAFASIFGSCKENDEALNAQFELDVPFTVQPGAVYQLKTDQDLSVELKEVFSDSRCPQDVECVWAGKADAAFLLKYAAQNQPDTLSYGDTSGSKWPKSTKINTYKVELKEVKPGTKAGQKIPKEDYRLQLLVTKDK